MNKKIVAVVVVTVILALFHLTQAQQPAKVARIEFLTVSTAAAQTPYIDAFHRGLRDFGYIVGKKRHD